MIRPSPESKCNDTSALQRALLDLPHLFSFVPDTKDKAASDSFSSEDGEQASQGLVQACQLAAYVVAEYDCIAWPGKTLEPFRVDF